MIVDNLSEEGIVGFQINDYLEYRPDGMLQSKSTFPQKCTVLTERFIIVCIPGWKVIVK